MEGHGGPFVLMPALILIGMLPFSLLLFVKSIWKSIKIDDLAVYAAICVLTTTLFFSISGTKLPNYIMPAYPMLAIFIGSIVLHVRSFPTWWVWTTALLPFFLILVILIGFHLHPQLELSHSHIILGTLGCLAIACLKYIKNFTTQTPSDIVTIGIRWGIFSLLVFSTYLPYVASQSPVQNAFHKIPDLAHSCQYYGQFDPAFPFYLDQNIDTYQLEDPSIAQPKYIISTAKHKSAILAQGKYRLVFIKRDLFENRINHIWELEQ